MAWAYRDVMDNQQELRMVRQRYWAPGGGGTSQTITVTTTTPGVAGVTGSPSTFSLGNTFPPLLPFTGSWSVGDWTGDAATTPTPSGWTVSGPINTGGPILFTAAGNGPTPELSWDSSGLLDNGGGSGVSLFDSGSYTPGVAGVAPVNQVDTISLPANTNGGTWELGGTTGIAYNDDGSGVQAAYNTWAAANSYSGATITKASAGTYTVTYAVAGDQTAVTAALAPVTFGDTLTQS